VGKPRRPPFDLSQTAGVFPASLHVSAYLTIEPRNCSAGVVGLTTAYVLSQRGTYSVTVVARHMPGDYDIEYASMWAGANYLP
jgi:hypothetical protein